MLLTEIANDSRAIGVEYVGWKFIEDDICMRNCCSLYGKNSTDILLKKCGIDDQVVLKVGFVWIDCCPLTRVRVRIGLSLF